MTSTIKVNNIQNQCGQNIINENSNTITIGASGDTIALASGASQTGFGRTGTVDWQTGSIKTATFTAANGEGYFANTSGGAFTMNLPAGSAGSIVSVVDYTNTFQTNNLTITPNGSQKIGGVAASNALSTEGQSVTFVYVDDTEGWKNIQDSTSNITGVSFVTATGGTITTCGNFKIHTFTGPGTFAVSSISTTTAENTVGYAVVAGGGGGASEGAGGGGAGGYREGRNATVDNFTASPLVANAPTNAVTLTVASFPITVGSGGAGGTAGSPPAIRGVSGGVSTFSTITSAGGGGGGSRSAPCAGNPASGVAGGSGGGGGGGCGSNTNPGGAGNTPPVSPAQGSTGGSASGPTNSHSGGGGGGATAVGGNTSGNSAGGAGGAGATSSITGSPVARGGGGGGSGRTSPGSAPGGAGGTGGGGNGEGNPAAPGTAGTVNTGGGGGGTEFVGTNGFNGGSGIVIIRYKFQ